MCEVIRIRTLNRYLCNLWLAFTLCVLIRRDNCGHFGTRPCAQIPGLHDKHSHGWLASKDIYANKWLLCDKTVPISEQWVYFHGMVTLVACCAGSHRTIYKQDFGKLDIKSREFVQAIVGSFCRFKLVCPMAQHPSRVYQKCPDQHWKWANCIANLPETARVRTADFHSDIDKRLLFICMLWAPNLRYSTVFLPSSCSFDAFLLGLHDFIHPKK